jgi:hypothetical protein
MPYNGQAEQDKFVINILKEKRNGFFIEIGSNHPININNSYKLESEYDWKGIMVEYDASFLPLYKEHRKNSVHIIQDASKVNYMELFEANNVPLNIDYLQIDLEVSNGSTIDTLEKLNVDILDTYKFASVTFEHDIYHTNYKNTRLRSREIFMNRGYYRVFDDINNQGICPYEDWYVHPDLVDMKYIYDLQRKNIKHYKPSSIPNIISINWQDIEY